jgi:hypothetical protein
VLGHDAGVETKRLSDEQKRELRGDALRWLREWRAQPPPTGLDVFLVKRDPAFRFVRDPEFLDQLAPPESQEWRDLWEEIHATRGSGNERFALTGDKVAPPPREVKR